MSGDGDCAVEGEVSERQGRGKGRETDWWEQSSGERSSRRTVEEGEEVEQDQLPVLCLCASPLGLE